MRIREVISKLIDKINYNNQTQSTYELIIIEERNMNVMRAR